MFCLCALVGLRVIARLCFNGLDRFTGFVGKTIQNQQRNILGLTLDANKKSVFTLRGSTFHGGFMERNGACI